MIDKERLQFTSGMKIIPKERSRSGFEEIWVLSNSVQAGRRPNGRDYKEVNFRVSMQYVQDLISNTKCATT